MLPSDSIPETLEYFNYTDRAVNTARGMPCDQQLAPRRQGNCKRLQQRSHVTIDTDWSHMTQLLFRGRDRKPEDRP